MKRKNLLLVFLSVALVLAFSAVALGAGKNNEQTYIGTWKNDIGGYIYIYPCHVGEHGKDSLLFPFDWTVDNGYLVIHEAGRSGNWSISCYYSEDSGKTMLETTSANSIKHTYTKVK